MEWLLDVVKEFKFIRSDKIILLMGSLNINEHRITRPLVNVIMSELTIIFFFFCVEAPFTAVLYVFFRHRFQCRNSEETKIKDPP